MRPKRASSVPAVNDPLPGWLALLVAMAILLGVTLYPPFLAGRQGGADHGMLLSLCWAMSAGFVRGVGFVPRHRLAHMLLSGWAVLLALAIFLLQWQVRG